MDNAGPISVSTHKSSRRKFFQWAVKWFYTDQTEDVIIKPDAPELACLLQAIGFQLREFEKHEDNNGQSKTKNDTLKVIIECGSSKMRAVMELDDITCQCPNQDDAKDASFWSVSGTGPLGSMENMNRVVETGSNLLPSISKGDANIVHDVTQRLFKLIKNIPDVNQNTDSRLNLASIEKSLKIPSNNEASVTLLTRRHTQPDFNTGRCRSLDTLTKYDETVNDKTNSPSPLPPEDPPMPRHCSSSDSRGQLQLQNPSWNQLDLEEESEIADLMGSSPIPSRPFPMLLQRQKTFDMDIETSSVEGEPRPSPPKISSSPVPVPQLCSSLGQISLQSDVKDVSLVEMLVKAKTNLEVALKMLATNPQISSMLLEDPFLKPARPRSSSAFKISPGNNTRSESSCSLPVYPISRNSPLPKLSVRRNVAASFRKNSDALKSPVDKKSTTMNRSLLQRRSLGSRLPGPKPLSLKIDASRPGTNGNSSNSSTSRIIIAAKRRVSPDPKNGPSQIQKPNTPLNTSSLQKNSLSSRHKLQPSMPSPKNLPGAIGANKFGFIKKKV